MNTITIVTGNPNKLKEIRRLAPTSFELAMQKLDLPEIQSMDLHEIVRDKLQRAYEAIGTPVIVEDVSAGLDNLGGLPGPFFKFFEQRLGSQALLHLSKKPGEPITITCTAGYYDGHEMTIVDGVIHGTVVKPCGDNGFGFDPVVVPDGESRTMAEMSAREKNAISHRGQAFRALFARLAG